MSEPFSLAQHQVPAFPEAGSPGDQLRWTVTVMDADDKDFAFVASLLSHFHKFGELSDRQWKYGQKTVSRARAQWEASTLKCQTPAGSRPRLVTSAAGAKP